MPLAMENNPELSELIDARREIDALRGPTVRTVPAREHGDLMNVLYEAGRRIASEFDAPGTRAGWVTYILEVLQDEVVPQEYAAMLERVRADIDTRLQAGRW
jgi:hypothetical protein